jgi:hypothetical protein
MGRGERVGKGMEDGRTYAAGKVTAVLTLHGDVFGAFEGGVEDWVGS